MNYTTLIHLNAKLDAALTQLERGYYAIKAYKKLAGVHNVNPPSGAVRAALRKDLTNVRRSGSQPMTHVEAVDAMKQLRGRAAGELKTMRETYRGRRKLKGSNDSSMPSYKEVAGRRYGEEAMPMRKIAVGGWA